MLPEVGIELKSAEEQFLHHTILAMLHNTYTDTLHDQKHMTYTYGPTIITCPLNVNTYITRPKALDLVTSQTPSAVPNGTHKQTA